MLIECTRGVTAQRANGSICKSTVHGIAHSEDIEQSKYQSWKAHVSNGNSHKLIRRMDKYYQSLWEDLICAKLSEEKQRNLSGKTNGFNEN